MIQVRRLTHSFSSSWIVQRWTTQLVRTKMCTTFSVLPTLRLRTILINCFESDAWVVGKEPKMSDVTFRPIPDNNPCGVFNVWHKMGTLLDPLENAICTNELVVVPRTHPNGWTSISVWHSWPCNSEATIESYVFPSCDMFDQYRIVPSGETANADGNLFLCSNELKMQMSSARWAMSLGGSVNSKHRGAFVRPVEWSSR